MNPSDPIRPVDPVRLKQLRTLRDLSQAELADKTRPRLTKQTIHRLERGLHKSIRKSTVAALCAALGVEPEILSGRKPILLTDQPGREPSEDLTYQLNTRLDAAVRNAFSLVALRYKIPVSKIVELAPFLFVVAAEQSLQYRREKLAEAAEASEKWEKLQPNFPHLPAAIADATSSLGSVEAEDESISELDIFAQNIPNEIYWNSGETTYDEDSQNPFVQHLQRLAAASGGAAEIERMGSGPIGPSYEVCRGDARALAGGDDSLASGLLKGWALIHELPKQLLRKDAVAARIEWMRPKIEEARKLDEAWNNLTPEEMIKVFESIDGKGEAKS